MFAFKALGVMDGFNDGGDGALKDFLIGVDVAVTAVVEMVEVVADGFKAKDGISDAGSDGLTPAGVGHGSVQVLGSEGEVSAGRLAKQDCLVDVAGNNERVCSKLSHGELDSCLALVHLRNVWVSDGEPEGVEFSCGDASCGGKGGNAGQRIGEVADGLVQCEVGVVGHGSVQVVWSEGEV